MTKWPTASCSQLLKVKKCAWLFMVTQAYLLRLLGLFAGTELGLDAQMLPGVSAEDCGADLGIIPLAGCQSCKQLNFCFAITELTLMTQIIWQMGLAGDATLSVLMLILWIWAYHAGRHAGRALQKITTDYLRGSHPAPLRAKYKKCCYFLQFAKPTLISTLVALTWHASIPSGSFGKARFN